MLSLLVYIRPTHESAQSFRPCVYGQFDIRNPWSETRASLSNRAIFTVGGATSSTFLSKLYRKSHDISSSHVNHRELLVKLTLNMPKINVRADSRVDKAIVL